MKTAFVLHSNDHGPLLVNRFDYAYAYAGKWAGVGAELMENRCYQPATLALIKQLLAEKRKYVPKPVNVIDCGANIGVVTLELANFMHDWGQILAIEPQERLYYALVGNLTVQNAFNARAIHAAVDAQQGFIDIPEPDYCQPGNFGGFELHQPFGMNDVGQAIDYDKPTLRVQTVTIDEIVRGRVDFIKLDIEGMEMDALAGATAVLARDRPILFIEVIKIDRDTLETFLAPLGYKCFSHEVMNVVAVHRDDPTIACIQTIDKPE